MIVSGTSLGQLITLAAIPLIARLYTPSEVGELAVITSLAYVGTTLATGRYELAVALPRDDHDAALLAGLAIRLSITFGAIGGAVTLVAWSLWGESILGIRPASLLFVFALCAVGGLFGALNYLAVRSARFSAVATRSLVRAIAVSGAQIIAGLTPIKTVGLPGGLLFGEIVATASILRLKGLPKASGSRAERRSGRRRLAREYIRFPRLLAPSSLVNAAGQHGTSVFVSALFGVATAGFLSMAQRAVAAPVGVITTAVSQVYISRFSRSVRSREPGARSLFMAASLRLGIVGVLIGIALLSVAPTILEFILGSEWQRAGEFVRALTPLVATQVLASPLSQTLILLEHVSLQLAWDVARLVAVAAALIVSNVVGLPAITAIWIYSLSAGAMNCIAWLLCQWAVRRYERNLRQT